MMSTCTKNMNFDEKQCPYCAETIKSAAVKCKFCNANLLSNGIRSGIVQSSSRSNFAPVFSGIFGMALVILFATNPNKSQFVEMATQKISAKLNQSDEIQNPDAKKFVTGLAGVFLDEAIKQDNYLFFSTYTLDLHLLRLFNAETPDVKFLGIAGQFIPLNSSFLTEGSAVASTPPKVISNTFVESNSPKEEVIDIPETKPIANTSNSSHENVFQNQLLNSMLSAAYDQNTDQLSTDYGKLKLSPKPDVGDKSQSRKFNSQGLFAFQNADYVTAENLFQSAYDQNHADPEVINNLGYTQFKEGKYNLAVASIQKTLLIAPDRASAWFNLYEGLAMNGGTDSSICGSLALGLKFSGNRQKSIDVLNQRIADESNLAIRQKLANGINCALEKAI